MMGYDNKQRPAASSMTIAVLATVALVAALAMAVAGGAAVYWMRSSRLEARHAAEHRAVAEQHRAKLKVREAAEKARAEAARAATLVFEVEIDRDGNASVGGEPIGLEALRARLARLREVSSDMLSVRFNADSNCPVKHVVPLVEVCEGAGEIDYHLTVHNGS